MLVHRDARCQQLLQGRLLLVMQRAQLTNDVWELLRFGMLSCRAQQGIVQQSRVPSWWCAVALQASRAFGQPISECEVGRLGNVETRVEASMISTG